jgi:hypothetical protein
VLPNLPQRRRRTAPTERSALLVCFAALLAVLAILGAAKIARAAESPDPSEPDVQLAEEDWEVEAEEECVEAEAPEEAEEEPCEEGAEEPEPCPLRSAHAHLAERHNQLKLTIGYTTNEPTPALIKVQSGATKTFKRQLSQAGVLRFSESANDLHQKVVIRIEAIGRAGCPSRRLVLFRRESGGASPTRPHRKS